MTAARCPRPLASFGVAGLVLSLAACGWNPSRPFEREAPEVREALAQLDGGDASVAARTLEDYLSTGPCKAGSIGTPDSIKRKADGTFDLGLALFRVGEQYGRLFGDEEAKGDENVHARRHDEIQCAVRVVNAVALDESNRAELRARAHYLGGNLEFLDGEYEDAVRAYDAALVLAPGQADAGDPVGRDAAWNRAIALRRIEDKKDAGSDASTDGPSEAAPSDGGDRGDARSNDGGDKGPKDGGKEAESPEPDGGKEGGDDGAAQAPPPDAGDTPREAAVPPPTTNEDERMLDQLESAPTLQQEEAKRFGRKRVRGMVDK